MFEKVGEKIKIAAIIITVINLIGAFVGCISIWSLPSFVFSSGFVKFLVGLVALAVGAVIAFFIGLMLQGFGIIVESHESKSEKVLPTPKSNPIFPANRPVGDIAIKNDGSWECSECGTRNTSGYCVSCGKKKRVQNVPNTQVNNNLWVCGKCGAKNAGGFCVSCGSPRSAGSAYYRSAPVLDANSWMCPSCGRINQNYVGSCGCGQPKP